MAKIDHLSVDGIVGRFSPCKDRYSEVAGCGANYTAITCPICCQTILDRLEWRLKQNGLDMDYDICRKHCEKIIFDADFKEMLNG